MRTLATASLVSIALAALACGDDTSPAGEGGGGGGSTATTTSSTTGPTTGATTATTTTTTTTGSTGEGGAGGTGDGGAGGESGEGGAGGGTTGAGGSGATCDAEPSAERDAAALAYGQATCDYYERCLPGFFVLFGGDVALCSAVATATIAAYANVDDPALVTCLEDAAALFERAACSPSSTPSALPASCDQVGVLADGAACSDSLECASGACLVDPPDDCGTCVPRVEPGGACAADVECGALACVEGTCQEAQPDGTPCDAARDCEGGACAQGTCATVVVAGLGEPCGGLATCDPTVPLLCGEDGECVENPRPEPGQLDGPCVPYPVDFGGGFVIPIGTCEPGATCVEDVCVVAAAPGGSCAGGEACVASSCEDGVCAVEDPNLCACGE